MTQRCTVTGRTFEVSESEHDLLRRVAELNPLLGSTLPLPIVYPTETLRQMAPFGNQLHLHRVRSVISGAPILSRFDTSLGFQVVSSDEFWSDDIENTEHGRPYDFTRPFFDQWNELLRRVALLPLLNDRNENCEYANGCFNCKDCCLCFDTTESRDCLYCYGCHRGESCIDCVHITASSFCASSSDLGNCYDCRQCTDCSGCSSCFACTDCRGCESCIGCTGLRNGSYAIFNEPVGKEGYEKFLRENDLSHRETCERVAHQAHTLRDSASAPVNRIIASEDCTGSYIRNSSNLLECFNTIGSKDCSFLLGSVNSRDLCKGFGYNSELGYSAVSSGCYNCHFSYSTSNCRSCWYSYYLFNDCTDCFGCIGLKKKRYCVLNRQLSKEDYEKLVPRIVRHMESTGEWGRWFPVSSAPSSYQESWAHEYLEEISEKEAARRGYRSAPVKRSPAGPDAIELRDHTPEPSLSGKPIRCTRTGELFSLQAQELALYRRSGIPIPSIHWRERLRDLLRARDRMPDILS